MTVTLLTDQDPVPFRLYPERQPSPFVLVSDHAGRDVPSALEDMGLSPADWERHIAYDIGIRPVGLKLRERLGACLIEQVYSRLVIDCNRAPGHPSSVPAESDHTLIPANQSLTQQYRHQREREILYPYHEAIDDVLKSRGARQSFLISLHSFTPEMNGVARPWHVGILYNRDKKTARTMIELLRKEEGICVGDNEPYVLTDVNDFTVPHHAERVGLPYLEIEIRQDLIADDEGQTLWADRLARLLPLVWERRKQPHD